MISFVDRKSIFTKILSATIAFTFIFTSIVPPQARAQMAPMLPPVGTMIMPTGAFNPAIIKGVSIHPDNPLQFTFIVNKGDTGFNEAQLKDESTKLIKYFLASLTVPEKEMWVNLSPYEKNRIIPKGLGVTELGRDMLAQDYLLKQLTSSLIYPEKEIGKKFWEKVYKEAQEKYGTTDIPMNTFNKVWIVPEDATVYVHENNAFVVDSHLKVMLEEDYVALQKNLGNKDLGANNISEDDAKIVSGISSDVVREVVIPAIEKEVNTGETFANLRQIFNSMILATWYKQNLKETLLNQVYSNQNKTLGVDVKDKDIKQKIYAQYLAAFKKGVYNYIKEDYDPAQKEIVQRKYFSGGIVIGKVKEVRNAADLTLGQRSLPSVGDGLNYAMTADVVEETGGTGDEAKVKAALEAKAQADAARKETLMNSKKTAASFAEYARKIAADENKPNQEAMFFGDVPSQADFSFLNILTSHFSGISKNIGHDRLRAMTLDRVNTYNRRVVNVFLKSIPKVSQGIINEINSSAEAYVIYENGSIAFVLLRSTMFGKIVIEKGAEGWGSISDAEFDKIANYFYEQHPEKKDFSDRNAAMVALDGSNILKYAGGLIDAIFAENRQIVSTGTTGYPALFISKNLNITKEEFVKNITSEGKEVIYSESGNFLVVDTRQGRYMVKVLLPKNEQDEVLIKVGHVPDFVYDGMLADAMANSSEIAMAESVADFRSHLKGTAIYYDIVKDGYIIINVNSIKGETLDFLSEQMQNKNPKVVSEARRVISAISKMRRLTTGRLSDLYAFPNQASGRVVDEAMLVDRKKSKEFLTAVSDPAAVLTLANYQENLVEYKAAFAQLQSDRMDINKLFSFSTKGEGTFISTLSGVLVIDTGYAKVRLIKDRSKPLHFIVWVLSDSEFRNIKKETSDVAIIKKLFSGSSENFIKGSFYNGNWDYTYILPADVWKREDVSFYEVNGKGDELSVIKIGVAEAVMLNSSADNRFFAYFSHKGNFYVLTNHEAQKTGRDNSAKRAFNHSLLASLQKFGTIKDGKATPDSAMTIDLSKYSLMGKDMNKRGKVSKFLRSIDISKLTLRDNAWEQYDTEEAYTRSIILNSLKKTGLIPLMSVETTLVKEENEEVTGVILWEENKRIIAISKSESRKDLYELSIINKGDLDAVNAAMITLDTASIQNRVLDLGLEDYYKKSAVDYIEKTAEVYFEMSLSKELTQDQRRNPIKVDSVIRSFRGKVGQFGLRWRVNGLKVIPVFFSKEKGTVTAKVIISTDKAMASQKSVSTAKANIGDDAKKQIVSSMLSQLDKKEIILVKNPQQLREKYLVISTDVEGVDKKMLSDVQVLVADNITQFLNREKFGPASFKYVDRKLVLKVKGMDTKQVNSLIKFTKQYLTSLDHAMTITDIIGKRTFIAANDRKNMVYGEIKEFLRKLIAAANEREDADPIFASKTKKIAENREKEFIDALAGMNEISMIKIDDTFISKQGNNILVVLNDFYGKFIIEFTDNTVSSFYSVRQITDDEFALIKAKVKVETGESDNSWMKKSSIGVTWVKTAMFKMQRMNVVTKHKAKAFLDEFERNADKWSYSQADRQLVEDLRNVRNMRDSIVSDGSLQTLLSYDEKTIFIHFENVGSFQIRRSAAGPVRFAVKKVFYSDLGNAASVYDFSMTTEDARIKDVMLQWLGWEDGKVRRYEFLKMLKEGAGYLGANLMTAQIFIDKFQENGFLSEGKKDEIGDYWVIRNGKDTITQELVEDNSLLGSFNIVHTKSKKFEEVARFLSMDVSDLVPQHKENNPVEKSKEAQFIRLFMNKVFKIKGDILFLEAGKKSKVVIPFKDLGVFLISPENGQEGMPSEKYTARVLKSYEYSQMLKNAEKENLDHAMIGVEEGPITVREEAIKKVNNELAKMDKGDKVTIEQAGKWINKGKKEEKQFNRTEIINVLNEAQRLGYLYKYSQGTVDIEGTMSANFYWERTAKVIKLRQPGRAETYEELILQMIGESGFIRGTDVKLKPQGNIMQVVLEYYLDSSRLNDQMYLVRISEEFTPKLLALAIRLKDYGLNADYESIPDFVQGSRGPNVMQYTVNVKVPDEDAVMASAADEKDILALLKDGPQSKHEIVSKFIENKKIDATAISGVNQAMVTFRPVASSPELLTAFEGFKKEVQTAVKNDQVSAFNLPRVPEKYFLEKKLINSDILQNILQEGAWISENGVSLVIVTEDIGAFRVSPFKSRIKGMEGFITFTVESISDKEFTRLTGVKNKKGSSAAKEQVIQKQLNVYNGSEGKPKEIKKSSIVVKRISKEIKEQVTDVLRKFAQAKEDSKTVLSLDEGNLDENAGKLKTAEEVQVLKLMDGDALAIFDLTGQLTNIVVNYKGYYQNIGIIQSAKSKKMKFNIKGVSDESYDQYDAMADAAMVGWEPSMLKDDTAGMQSIPTGWSESKFKLLLKLLNDYRGDSVKRVVYEYLGGGGHHIFQVEMTTDALKNALIRMISEKSSKDFRVDYSVAGAPSWSRNQISENYVRVLVKPDSMDVFLEVLNEISDRDPGYQKILLTLLADKINKKYDEAMSAAADEKDILALLKDGPQSKHEIVSKLIENKKIDAAARLSNRPMDVLENLLKKLEDKNKVRIAGNNVEIIKDKAMGINVFLDEHILGDVKVFIDKAYTEGSPKIISKGNLLDQNVIRANFKGRFLKDSLSLNPQSPTIVNLDEEGGIVSVMLAYDSKYVTLSKKNGEFYIEGNTKTEYRVKFVQSIKIFNKDFLFFKGSFSEAMQIELVKGIAFKKDVSLTWISDDKTGTTKIFVFEPISFGFMSKLQKMTLERNLNMLISNLEHAGFTASIEGDIEKIPDPSVYSGDSFYTEVLVSSPKQSDAAMGTMYELQAKAVELGFNDVPLTMEGYLTTTVGSLSLTALKKSPSGKVYLQYAEFTQGPNRGEVKFVDVDKGVKNFVVKEGKVFSIHNEIDSDGQLFVDSLADVDSAMTPGGINLDPSLLNLQIKRDSNWVPLPIDQQDIKNMNIQGFVPIIIDVSPSVNLPMLLGFDYDENSGNKKSGANNTGFDPIDRKAKLADVNLNIES